MIVNVSKKAEELHLSLPDLITRPAGRAMYGMIRKIAEKMVENETLLLDFAGIKVVDSSFIDEMLVRLLLDSEEAAKRYHVKLRNISPIAETNINLVLRSYSNYKNKKIVVITENICNNNVFFIGPLSDLEKDIVEFIRINKSTTPEEAADFSGLSKKEMQSILEQLFKIGAVKKDKEGVFQAV